MSTRFKGWNSFGQKGENQKIKNATKVQYKGQKFDSKLELYMYQLLEQHKIKFDFRPKYTLQKSFVFQGQTVRSITYTPDFYIIDQNTFVDCKGYPNDVFPIKEKLFKKHLQNSALSSAHFIILKNKQEINEYIYSIACSKSKHHH